MNFVAGPAVEWDGTEIVDHMLVDARSIRSSFTTMEVFPMLNRVRLLMLVSLVLVLGLMAGCVAPVADAPADDAAAEPCRQRRDGRRNV